MWSAFEHSLNICVIKPDDTDFHCNNLRVVDLDRGKKPFQNKFQSLQPITLWMQSQAPGNTERGEDTWFHLIAF